MRCKTIIISILIAQLSIFGTIAQKPEKIVSFVKESHPCEWYKTQSELWKKEAQKNKKNAYAWSNYYRATRYSVVMCPLDSADEYKRWAIMDSVTKPILNQMKKWVPDSYEYNHLMYYASGNGDNDIFQYIDRAYQIDSNRVDGFPDIIIANTIRGNTDKNKAIIKRWYEKEPPSQGMIAWNYNMIVGLDTNAILFVDGDNDVYPKEWLQKVKNIRPDIKVVVVSLMYLDRFRDNLYSELNLPKFTKTMMDCKSIDVYNKELIMHILKSPNPRPIYFSTAMRQDFYSFMQDSLYLEGLVYKYSPERYDNVAVIKRNFDQAYLLDYIKQPFISDASLEIVNQMNLCYLLPLTQLYKHYKLSGELTKAENTAHLMILIAKTAENKEYLNFIQELTLDKK